jgi:hypothetical protein
MDFNVNGNIVKLPWWYDAKICGASILHGWVEESNGRKSGM